MIDTKDVVLLLSDLQDKTGVDMSKDIIDVMSSGNVSIDILKKINKEKPLDILNFYEKIRKSYNNKKSKLYINIMKADEMVIDNPKTILTTLSALLNQILQYNAEDQSQFYKFSRADEIAKVLEIYFIKYDLEPARKLLELAKADIKALQMIK